MTYISGVYMKQYFILRPVAIAISLSLTSITLSSFANVVDNSTASNQLKNQRFDFSIAAGSLTTSVNNIAQVANLTISYNPELTQGKSAIALNGSYTVKKALSIILEGTKLSATEKTDGGYTLTNNQNSSTVGTLALTTVNSESQKGGSAADGYKVDEISSVGPWQGRTLQETPYSINVVSEDLLQNLQATSTDQVFKINPLVQMSRPQAQQDQPYIFARGFQLTNTSRNGIARDIYGHGVSMEEIEKVEVLTGLSGFLYGPGNVGGLVNYVSKRPTEERLNSITLGNTSRRNFYLHGDFGGRLGEDEQFGYRLNLVKQDGETATEDQSIDRELISLTLDWQVTDKLLLQVDGSRRDYRLDGYQALWNLVGDPNRPDAEKIDSDILWGQKWDFQITETDRLGANLQWDINDFMSLRAGYLDERISRLSTSSSNYLYANNTFYQLTATNKDAPQDISGKSSYVYFDTNFSTGDIEHKVNIGLRTSDNKQIRFRDGRSQYDLIEDISLSQPLYIDEPIWDVYGIEGRYKRSQWGSDSISIGDDISFNEQWSVLIGINHSRIYSESFSIVTDIVTYSYDESAITPTLSLVYQPMNFVTTYVSYMESLERGGQASDEPDVVNREEMMDPLMSTQIEIGAKVDLNGVLLTTALFEINKGLEYYAEYGENQRIFVQDGRQIHRGIEFTATGQLSDNLTLVGGFTVLDAEIKELKDNPDLEGKTPRNVAERMFKLYLEYTLPWVPGLVVNSGFNYTGDFYGNVDNTDNIDGYTLLDIGARYQFAISETPVTLRFNISNLTDERYWANNQYLGDGRRMSLSANVTF